MLMPSRVTWIGLVPGSGERDLWRPAGALETDERVLRAARRQREAVGLLLRAARVDPGETGGRWQQPPPRHVAAVEQQRDMRVHADEVPRQLGEQHAREVVDSGSPWS